MVVVFGALLDDFETVSLALACTLYANVAYRQHMTRELPVIKLGYILESRKL